MLFCLQITLLSINFILEKDVKLYLPSFGQHSCNEDGITRPLILVTASVDRMVLKKPIHIDIDLTIVGAVTRVGRSSMEIQLELNQSKQGQGATKLITAQCFINLSRKLKIC